MRNARRILAVLVILAALGGLLWLAVRPDGRLLEGRTRAAWLESLNAGLTSNSFSEWRALGPDAVPILAAALEQGRRPRDKVWQKILPHLPAFIKRRLPKPKDRFLFHRNAVRLLGAIDADLGPAAPALAQAMNDEDAEVRVNAAKNLADVIPKLGREKIKLLPDFIRASQDTNYEVRLSAVEFLSQYPDHTGAVAPALAKSLADPQQFVRIRAMSALRALDPQAAAKAGLAGLLVPYLTNQDTMVRVNVAAELGAMKSDATIVVPALMELLDNYLPVTRFAAVKALGNFGRDAQPAVPALVKLLSDEPRVSGAASNSLLQIDPAAAAKAFATTRATTN